MLAEVPDDTRPKRHGWAPGGYICTCRLCGKRFTGDKRARNCAPCAYALPDDLPTGDATSLQHLMIKARENLGLSQKDFAKQLNVSPQYVCDLEHGRRLGSVQHVDAICDLIGAWPTMREAWHRAGARAHGWKV